MEPNGHDHLTSSRRGEPRRAKPQAELERGAARGAKPHSGSWTSALEVPGSTSRRGTTWRAESAVQRRRPTKACRARSRSSLPYDS